MVVILLRMMALHSIYLEEQNLVSKLVYISPERLQIASFRNSIRNVKIAYIKLDEENKKNIKIIEEIIIESGRNQKNSELIKMNQDELENEVKNIFSIANPSEKTLFKLKEVLIK